MWYDVVLIQPRDPTLDRLPFETITIAAVDLPPLSLLYLGTVLLEKDFQVKIVDFNAFSYREQAEEELVTLLRNSPPVVGISAMTPTFPGALEIAKKVKEYSPSTVVIMGGHHVTFLPIDALRNSYVDYVIRGEGEYILPDLISHVIHNKPIQAEIPGISFVKDKAILHTPGMGLIHDLDALPYPDRSLLDLSRYKNPSSVISTRGCPARCIFCAAGAFPRHKYRLRSPENVVGEFIYLKENYNFGTISLVDNTFTGLRERSMKICDLIIKHKLNITWICETRVTAVDKNLVEKMARAGCVAIQFGVESGDERVLKGIRKGIKLEWVEKAIDLCLQVGIKPGCSFMIGLPFDTLETVNKTIKFARKLREKGTEIFFGITTPYPGTELFNRRNEYGIKIVDWDYSKWDTVHAVIETKHFSQREIEELFIEAVIKIYSVMEASSPM
jgi:radical SAM superfamily enzyme YgiQ (UPF0313 family)